jgi:hypothetical protein
MDTLMRATGLFAEDGLFAMVGPWLLSLVSVLVVGA